MRRLAAALLWVPVLVPLLALRAASPDGAADGSPGWGGPWSEHLDRISRSVLPVRAVLKVHASLGGETHDLENDAETVGVVVDAQGTLMVSNTALGGTSSPLLQVLTRRVPGIELHVDVTRLVVLVGEGHEEREASLLVRDSARDLAWIQVKDAAERPIPAIELGEAPGPAVGQRLLAVTRMARGFDYAPDLARLTVSGRISRPRALFSVSSDLTGVDALGHMVFDLSGRPLGALITQEGVGGGEDASVRMMLLPVDGVRASLKAARAASK